MAETRALQGAAADRAGCVVSFPGTPAQQLHTDGAPLTLTLTLILTLATDPDHWP